MAGDADAAVMTRVQTDPLDVDAVLSECEDFEFSAASSAPPDVLCRCASIHILANLVKGDLDNARFVWKRVPQELKTAAPELAAAWEMGKCLWGRDVPGFYAAAQAHRWGPGVAILVSAAVSAVQQRQFLLLSRAYTRISVADAAKALGSTPAETTARCTAAGWTVDGDVLSPAPSGSGSGSGGGGGGGGGGGDGAGASGESSTTSSGVGNDQLAQLTNYVVHLEKRTDPVELAPESLAGAGAGAGPGVMGGGDAEML